MRLRSAIRILFLGILCTSVWAESSKGFRVQGLIRLDGKPVADAAVGIRSLNLTVFSDANGNFLLEEIPRGQYDLEINHPHAQPQVLPIFVKRAFRIDTDLIAETAEISSEPVSKGPYTAPSSSHDPGSVTTKAVSVLGLSPQYYTFLPSVAKMGVLFEAPVIRGQNPMLNAYVVDGVVQDMPFHSFGLYSTANLYHAESVKMQRGPHAMTERDSQGAARIDVVTPAGKSGKNGFEVAASPLISNAAIHYQVLERAWGSVAVRRTLLELYIDATSTIPEALDYQTRNQVRIDGKNTLEIAAFGAADVIPISAQQQFRSVGHSQRISFIHANNKADFGVHVKNRYLNRNLVVLQEKKNVSSLHPFASLQLNSRQHISVGGDFFYEGQSASIQNSSEFSISNVEQLKNLSLGTFDTGNGVAVGGNLGYRGQFGIAAVEASSRVDKYHEYESIYSANSLRAQLQITPELLLHTGGSNANRRPDPFKSLALTGNTAQKPERNYKVEAGAGYQLFKFIQLQATAFYSHWDGLLSLKPDFTNIGTDSFLYQSNTTADSTGVETSALMQFKKWYVRASYTYQHTPSGDGFSYYLRRHVANTALIYQTGKHSHTVQFKVWSIPSDIKDRKEDAFPTTMQLDYRWTITSQAGFFFTFEVGQILNPIYLALVPKRQEYYDANALGNSLLGGATRGSAQQDLPFHLNLSAGFRL